MNRQQESPAQFFALAEEHALRSTGGTAERTSAPLAASRDTAASAKLNSQAVPAAGFSCQPQTKNPSLLRLPTPRRGFPMLSVHRYRVLTIRDRSVCCRVHPPYSISVLTNTLTWMSKIRHGKTSASNQRLHGSHLMVIPCEECIQLRSNRRCAAPRVA